jgi:hypothetical protein
MVDLGITQLTDIVAPLCDQSSAALLPASAFLGSLRDKRTDNRPRCADDRPTQSRAAADERDCDLGSHNGQSGMVLNVSRDTRRYGQTARLGRAGDVPNSCWLLRLTERLLRKYLL